MNEKITLYFKENIPLHRQEFDDIERRRAGEEQAAKRNVNHKKQWVFQLKTFKTKPLANQLN